MIEERHPRRGRGPRASRPRLASVLMALLAVAGTSTAALAQVPVEEIKEAAERIYTSTTDPGRDVRQPEDARINTVTFSPNFRSDRTLYAVAPLPCSVIGSCPSALFRSTDGGGSWERLPAENFTGFELALPPAYGRGDDRIFGLGNRGLEISEDGGQTFAVAGPGSSAGIDLSISPRFNDDDPTILLTGGVLRRYRDDLGITEPVPGAGTHTTYVAHSPDYGASREVFIGAVRVSPLDGRAVGAVLVCGEEFLCHETRIGESLIPEPRVPESIATSGLAYFFTANAIYTSHDRGRTLSRLSTPWNAITWDLAVDASGSVLYAATYDIPSEKPDGVFISRDGASTWRAAKDPLLAGGVVGVWESDGTVIAALANGGLACSANAGRSWGTRCP